MHHFVKIAEDLLAFTPHVRHVFGIFTFNSRSTVHDLFERKIDKANRCKIEN